MFKTLILAATAATAISVGAQAKTAVPNQEACRAVITAALDKVMKQAPPKGWLKNVPSVDLVIYDYQVYRRGDKSAFNWKPCDGTDLADLGYTMSATSQDLFDSALAGHAQDIQDATKTPPSRRR